MISTEHAEDPKRNECRLRFRNTAGIIMHGSATPVSIDAPLASLREAGVSIAGRWN